MKGSRKATRLGQSIVEFAIVGPIFFLCLFFATGIMLYEFERSLVVTGVTTGARDAVTATIGGSPNTPYSLSLSSAHATKLLSGSLLANSPGGTKVIDLNASPLACVTYGINFSYCAGNGPCLRAQGQSPLLSSIPNNTVFVYATGACGGGEAQVVAVGYPANLVGFLKIKIPLTIQATAVGVQYQR